jgi:hypothetical protein
VLLNGFERGIDGLGQEVSIGLVRVVVTLLECIRVNARSLLLSETELGSDGGPVSVLVSLLESEVILGGQQSVLRSNSINKCLVLVKEFSTICVGESSIASTAGNLRLSHEVHANVLHGVHKNSRRVSDVPLVSENKGGVNFRVIKETSSSPLKSSLIEASVKY